MAAAAAAATDNPLTCSLFPSQGPKLIQPNVFLTFTLFFLSHPTRCFLAFQVLQQLACCNGQRVASNTRSVSQNFRC
ncbi:hypothetical protein POTOM_042342 [Populus tomentosa]|uniref:Uncharacterized protein n=1 Tax=Populus tomentosa TaxID=118781 RepID=A0A8X7Z058_POPTO|nr:hypothetical protein POTOM_042342 [Populus tomentosa]